MNVQLCSRATFPKTLTSICGTWSLHTTNWNFIAACCAHSWVPAQEPSYGGPKGALRPVVKLWQHQMFPVYLTRVDPQRPDSSVLLRVRPGWFDTKSERGILTHLCGMVGRGGKKTDAIKKRCVNVTQMNEAVEQQ